MAKNSEVVVVDINEGKGLEKDLMGLFDDTDVAQLTSVISFEQYVKRRKAKESHDDIMSKVSRDTGQKNSGERLRKAYRVYSIIVIGLDKGLINSDHPFDANDISTAFMTAAAILKWDLSADVVKNEVLRSMSLICESGLVVKLPLVNGMPTNYCTPEWYERNLKGL